jgi:hypothetical protein
MSAKYSGVYLLGVAGLAFVMIRAGGDITPARPDADARGLSRHLRQAATSWLRLAVLACVAWWGFHLFAFSGPLKTLPLDQTPDSSPWVRVFGRGPIGQWVMQTAHERIHMPAPVAGLDFQQESSRRGYSAYFMGETSRSGWRLYYPAAFVFKSTPAELALTLCLIAAAAWSVPRLRTNWRRLDPVTNRDERHRAAWSSTEADARDFPKGHVDDPAHVEPALFRFPGVLRLFHTTRSARR